jgi:hypothetical protein
MSDPQQVHASQSSSATEDVSRMSPLRARAPSKGILKKTRRFSRDNNVTSGVLEIMKDANSIVEHVQQTNSVQSVVPEVSSQHSDERPSKESNAQSNSRDHFRRTSLQMAAFDRVLFAKRGAELREEFMRDLAGQEE